MKTSEQIDQLAAAFALARLEIETVPMSGDNPHFKSKFSTLSDIYSASNKPLAKQGLTVTQCSTISEGKVIVITRLMHKSGQWLETFGAPLKPRDDGPQSIGSTISYGRRYEQAAILGLASEDDDDGEAAHGRGNQEISNANQTIEKLTVALKTAQHEITLLKSKLNPVCDSKNEKFINRLRVMLTEAGLTQDSLSKITEEVEGKPFSEVATTIKKYKESYTTKLEDEVGYANKELRSSFE